MDLNDIGTEWNASGLLVLRPGEGEAEAPAWEDLTDAQRAAVEFFETQQEALFDIVCDALEMHVEQLEDDQRRAAERRDRQRGVDHQRQDAILYGEQVDESPVGAVDGGMRDLFDDPVDASDPWAGEEEEALDLEEPIDTRFEIERLVLLEGREPGRSALGFVGRADWEEEHGLGVVLDGFEIEAIGRRDLVG